MTLDSIMERSAGEMTRREDLQIIMGRACSLGFCLVSLNPVFHSMDFLRQYPRSMFPSVVANHGGRCITGKRIGVGEIAPRVIFQKGAGRSQKRRVFEDIGAIACAKKMIVRHELNL